MSKNQIEFGSNDKAALEYIRMRGYCSYGSMVNVRDKREPSTYSSGAQDFGKELHSRFLEKKKLVTLKPEEERMLKLMTCNLADDPIVQRLMEGALVEQEFDVVINGLRMFGRIDILTSVSVGDLKTTRHNMLAPFVRSMDFLQAAIYKRAKKKKDFYYVGTSKVYPHPPLIFSANSYPGFMKVADDQLDYYSRYIKSKL
jgi:hypothetical protein